MKQSEENKGQLATPHQLHQQQQVPAVVVNSNVDVESYPAFQGQSVVFVTMGGVDSLNQSIVIESFKKLVSLRLGATLIVASVLGVIFNAVDLGLMYPHYTYGIIGHGFWTGIMVK